MFRHGLPKPFLAIVLLLLIGGRAFGHPGKITAIDKFCMAIRQEFVEAAPRYFSGPTPWVELDSMPDTFADTAIASVYSEGPRVAWVVLAMSGPGDGWFETTDYFFDEAGRIAKRERYFQQLEANVKIEETTYFEKGKVIKTRFHHSNIEPGHENWDVFFDPHCPEYLSTADLPVLFFADQFKSLAGAKTRSGLRTARTGYIHASGAIPGKIYPSSNLRVLSDRLEKQC